eukprot:2944308-Pyramimonas_sp.AAC.1
MIRNKIWIICGRPAVTSQWVLTGTAGGWHVACSAQGQHPPPQISCNSNSTKCTCHGRWFLTSGDGRYPKGGREG